MNVTTTCNWGTFNLDTQDGITDDVRRVFTCGQCHAMALALNELIPGSRLVGIDWIDDFSADPQPDHVIVELPGGGYLDVVSRYDTVVELVDEWGVDDVQYVEPEQALNAFPDEDGEPCYHEPDLDAARAFAPIVVREYAPELVA